MKYREGVTVGAANTLIVLTALAVLGVSIRLYQNGQLGAEGVLVCTLSALSSFGPVVALANLGASLTQVFASADRVLDLLDEEPVTADVTDGADTVFTGAQAEHVSFAYAKEEVLHDLSLTIPEKKIVGITGRSGSGKSTFLRLLMRFWDVSSGTIRFGERDIRAVNTAALRAQESLVTQETELFDDTIENNIRIARRDATRARWRLPAERPRWMALSTACPRDMIPLWASWAVHSPAVSASASVWPVPSCTMHPFSCWTSLPPIWTA